MNKFVIPFRKRTRLRTKMLLATLIVVMIFMGINIKFFQGAQKRQAKNLMTDFSARLMAKTYNGFIYPMALGDTESVERELEQIGAMTLDDTKGEEKDSDKKGPKKDALRIHISNLQKQIRFSSYKDFIGNSLDNHLASQALKDALIDVLKAKEAGPEANLENKLIDALNSSATPEEARGPLEKALKTPDPLERNKKVEVALKFMSSEGNALANALEKVKNPPAPKTLEADLDGEPFMTAIKPIWNSRACYHCHGKGRTVLGAMVFQQPMANVYGEVRTSMLWVGGFSVGVLVCLVLIINLLFQGMVTKRLGALQEKTAQVADGDVNVKVFDDSIDSIGRLTRNFNTMIVSIRDRVEYANSLQFGISDPFFMTDPNRKITFVNNAALKLVGLSAPEVMERPCQEIFLAPTYRKECPVKKALATGEASVGQRIGLNNVKGVEVPVICSAALLKDSSDKVLGAFEIMRDLTVEVEAESRIKEAYAREEKAKKDLEAKVVELSEVLGKVSQGDLTPRGEPSGENDTMDVLTHRINETLNEMAVLIKQVKKATLPVINGVLRISRENQSLAQRTEQQAAAMEEISATLEELVSNTGENLANTRHADSLSKDAVKVAHEGGIEVEKTAQAMTEIETASAKVVEMMDLINEITFQTNLLSINAAVEAARAGEQGRGFAVVANEVRNLAKRSATAAKGIQGLVREIMEKVTTGRQWVGELQGRFSKIVQTSGQVSDALGEVSMGSEESSRGIEQINQGTQEVCEVNEKNASFVDELAQETQKLKEKARTLQELTRVFILGIEDSSFRQMDFPEESGEQESRASDPPEDYSRGERRRAVPTSRALRDDLVAKPTMEDLSDDLLEQEFEEGFEEF